MDQLVRLSQMEDFTSSDSDDSTDSDLDYSFGAAELGVPMPAALSPEAPSSSTGSQEGDARRHARKNSGLPPPPMRVKMNVAPPLQPESASLRAETKPVPGQVSATGVEGCGIAAAGTKPSGATVGAQSAQGTSTDNKRLPEKSRKAIRKAVSRLKQMRARRRGNSATLSTSLEHNDQESQDDLPKTTSSVSEALSPSSPTAKKSKRQRVLQEILQTEKTFVSSLRAFYKGYIDAIYLRDTPLKRELMSRGEIALLFSNIEQIITLNTDFLKRLESTMCSWPEESGGDAPDECVGEFFLSVAPLFALYAQYTSNHDLAVDVLKDHYKDREDFEELMESCEAEALRVMEDVTGQKRPPQPIGFYLIMPVQRVPRYKMLLQELLKRTPEGHRDLDSLPSAVAEVDKAAHKINETIRAREEKQKVVALSTRFLGHINLAGEFELYARAQPHRKVYQLSYACKLHGGWGSRSFVFLLVCSEAFAF